MYTVFIDVYFLTFNCLQFLRIKLIYLTRKESLWVPGLVSDSDSILYSQQAKSLHGWKQPNRTFSVTW